MAAVRETKLPGVGVKLEFTTDEGRIVGVLVHRNGRRELLIYDDDDPDSCSENLELTPADTRTLSELLGGSTVTEAVTAVQQQIEGLAIEWIEIPARSATIGTTIGDGQFRTRTGSSIVAVIRHGDTTPAPGPEFEFAGGDVAVAGGGTLLRQVLKAGLLDELELHIVPVVLGTGMRLLDADLDLADKEAIELIPIRVIPTPEVTHVRYTVDGRAALVLDDRGSGS